jgi:hypothetical protein
MNTKLIIVSLPADLPKCEHCGSRIAWPGVCQNCAAHITEVSHPTLVSVRVPKEKLLEPADLRD